MHDISEKQKQIADAVTQFVCAFMSARPTSVIVDLHDSHVFITLRRVVCPAEQEYARDRNSRERLERLFSQAFDMVKASLEKTVAEIVGHRVQHSRISLDPPRGDAILMLFIEESMKPRGVDGRYVDQAGQKKKEQRI